MQLMRRLADAQRKIFAPCPARSLIKLEDSHYWKFHISVMIVAPLPVVALFVLVQRVVFAIVLVTAVPIRVIDNHFVIVPPMVVVMIVVVVADRSGAANAHGSNQSDRRKGQNSGAALQGSHTMNPPSLTPGVKNEMSLTGTWKIDNGHELKSNVG